MDENNEKKIEIPDLPSNSIIERKEEKPKVVKARRVEKKGNAFLENLRSVGNYVLFEVLIPAAKNTISEMIGNGIDMLLFDEPRRRRRDDRGRGATHVSYESFSERFRDRERERGRERSRRSRFHVDEVEFNSREEAEEVLQTMFDLLDQYNVVTVSDLLTEAGLEDEYTDQNYGWTSLRDVGVTRVRDGWIIELPDPRLLPR